MSQDEKSERNESRKRYVIHKRNEYGSGKKKKQQTWAINEGGTHQSAEELLLALAQKITVWNW